MSGVAAAGAAGITVLDDPRPRKLILTPNPARRARAGWCATDVPDPCAHGGADLHLGATTTIHNNNTNNNAGDGTDG